MPRRKPTVICDECGETIRASRLSIHMRDKCIARLMECPYCSSTARVRQYQLEHGANCNRYLMTCHFCYGEVLAKDISVHTSQCPEVHGLIARYKPVCPFDIKEVMEIFRGYQKYSHVLGSTREYNWRYNEITRDVALETYICKNQLREGEGIVDGTIIEKILGIPLTLYNLRELITCLHLPVNEEDIPFNTYNAFGKFRRVYAEGDTFDFIHSSMGSALDHFKSRLREVLVEYLRYDVPGVVHEYMFSHRLYMADFM